MFGQRFHPGDLGTIGVLVVLEALLSADNALVLAIMARHLPHEQRKKALMYGIIGAFVLRTGAIILAASIIQFWWLQLIGAVYLLYLPINHFIKSAQGKEASGKEGMSFWATVVYLNIVDLAFALDSVIAAVAVVDTVRHKDKLWVVIAGAIIGIILLRFAAGYFIRLLEKYPVLDHVAYVLVGWAGLKLFLIAGHSFEEWWMMTHKDHLAYVVPEMSAAVFWVGMGIISIGGTLLAVRHPVAVTAEQEQESHEVEDAMHGWHGDGSVDDKPADNQGTDDGKKA